MKPLARIAVSALAAVACTSTSLSPAQPAETIVALDGGTRDGSLGEGRAPDSRADPLRCDFAECHIADETKCDGDQVRVCTFTEAGCGAWANGELCSDKGNVCRSANSVSACASPSAQQTQWLSNIKDTIALLERELAIAPQLKTDTDALYKKVERQLLKSPDALRSFSTAIRTVSLAYPDGHLFLGPENSCGTSANPYGSTSVVGACAQPYGAHAIVTHVTSTNPLGLTPGDQIVGINGKRNADMMRVALEQPLCASSSASLSNARYIAATSLFAFVQMGTKVEIQHLNGSVETKTILELSPIISCQDTYGRIGNFAARGGLRPDGVGVIRLVSLYKQAATFEEADALLHDEIDAAFAIVKNAPTLIWDLRANAGGSSLVGLEIVAGMNSVTAGTSVAAYDYRTPGTSTYESPYVYKIPSSVRYRYTGKVAVLIDGLTTSAGDYTALAAKRFGIPLVGAPTSASYGGGVSNVLVGRDPSVIAGVNQYRGLTVLGEAMEGKSVFPDVALDLSPTDLAAGRDTVMEAAIASAR